MRSLRWTISGIVLVASMLSLKLHAADTIAPPQLHLSLPLEYQVHQRATRSTGPIIVAGALSGGVQSPLNVEARLIGIGTDWVADWQKLATIDSGMTGFRAELTAPAGGWFRLEVRARHDSTVAAEGFVEHVGVGEVFVIAGQSNSANHGEEKQQTKTGLAAAFHDGRWRLADDPQPGRAEAAAVSFRHLPMRSRSVSKCRLGSSPAA